MSFRYCSMKSLKKKPQYCMKTNSSKKIPDPCIAKEHYQLFIKKDTKWVKELEIITHRQRSFEKPNIVDIEQVIREHSKTSHKLCKTIRKTERVGSNNSLKIKTYF